MSSFLEKDALCACKNKLLFECYLLIHIRVIICQCIKSILSNNVFTFNRECCLQVCGTEMGTRMAPFYGNIIMVEIDEIFWGLSTPTTSLFQIY